MIVAVVLAIVAVLLVITVIACVMKGKRGGGTVKEVTLNQVQMTGPISMAEKV